MQFVKIIVYVPETHAKQVRVALTENGCGKIGNYDSCSFSVKGSGRFRPLKGANPAIGAVGQNGDPGKIEKVAEERIETICPVERVAEVLVAVKKVHPYEEPAIDVFPLLDL